MTEQELKQITQWIKEATTKPDPDENIQLMLKLAGNSFTEDKLKDLIASPKIKKPPTGRKENDSDENFGIIIFSKKELSTTPKNFQKSFIVDNKIVRYRYHQGLFHACYRREGYKIEVASKDFETRKRKFMDRLCGQAEIPPRRSGIPKTPLFGEFGETWLETKKQTTKGSTYSKYERMFRKDLKPRFGHLHLSDINRPMLQSYLFEYTSAGKHRTAQKLKLILNCIFDLAAEDFNIKSPVKKIVLPYYESKKGEAFTKAEERSLWIIASPIPTA